MRVTLPESIPGNARRQLRTVLAARRRSAPAAERAEAALRVARNVDREVHLRARRLDVVFLPLVGFDAQGVRLGTGGGYYDRAFAFRRGRSAWHVPRLVGLAYAFQQVERIAPAAHDVLLDAVVTDEGIIRCST